MTALSKRIAGDDGDPVLQGSGGRTATTADLAATGLSDRIAADDRVALAVADPFEAVRALALLDGRVAAILLLSRSLAPDLVAELADKAGCTLCISDRTLALPGDLCLVPSGEMAGDRTDADAATAWLMTTSGTTGTPKIIPHNLRSLSHSVYRFGPETRPAWGLLYDPTRFAGLQVALQALVGGGRLIVTDPDAGIGAQVAALAEGGCTHLSATPTLWRRVLMTPGHDRLSLQQVTLGGEIADQSTLDALARAFPDARRTHIYASTEAGVGFSVTDGKAGFPETYLGNAPGRIRMDVRDGILWLKPAETALTTGVDGVEIDADGFVNSGDRVAVSDGRVTFLGRENGLINVGGAKVHPETVEAVIRSVPGVALVRVSGKASPVMGALVVAEIQLDAGADKDETRTRVQEACRAKLNREAMPASLRFVEDFEINASGKLVRART